MCIRDRAYRATAGVRAWIGVGVLVASIGCLVTRVPSLIGLGAVSYTHLDVYKRQVPDHALHLTDLGRRQAVAAGETVRRLIRGNVVVYASPYVRAREMVAGMALGVEEAAVRYEPRLREQDWANFQDPGHDRRRAHPAQRLSLIHI